MVKRAVPSVVGMTPAPASPPETGPFLRAATTTARASVVLTDHGPPMVQTVVRQTVVRQTDHAVIRNRATGHKTAATSVPVVPRSGRAAGPMPTVGPPAPPAPPLAGTATSRTGPARPIPAPVLSGTTNPAPTNRARAIRISDGPAPTATETRTAQPTVVRHYDPVSSAATEPAGQTNRTGPALSDGTTNPVSSAAMTAHALVALTHHAVIDLPVRVV